MANGHVISGTGQQQQQQTVALLDGDQVRCCTLNDHKLCDHHQPDLNGSIAAALSNANMNNMTQANMINMALKMNNNNNNNRQHLASEC